MSQTMPSPDRRLLLILCGAVLLIVVLVSIVAPASATNDPRPSSYSTAPGGVKAAYLTLQATGQPVARWEQSLQDLPLAEAPGTTLILAEPMYSALEKDRLVGALHSFLEHGGRLLTTGGSGALLLPRGAVSGSRRFGALCYTEPEGPGPLALVGKVEMEDQVRWNEEAAAGGPALRVEQRCGPDAVVVRLPVGQGEAIWWSSASPMTNAELHNDADLKLLLASVGPGRRVLFDESLQQPVRSKWTAARGLPLWSLLAQAGLVFALLVFSFSRRRGPIRLPVGVPRSSPVEFARSMGSLYERAGATGVAVAAARRRLQRVLVRKGGLPQTMVQRAAEGDAAPLANLLAARFGGEWRGVGEHLQAAAGTAETALKTSAALALVRALGTDAQRVQAAAHPPPAPAGAREEATSVS